MNWYEIKRSLVRFFTDIRIYVGGIIFFGDSHYQVKGPHIRSLLSNLQPGDVLLRRHSHYVGSLIVPGYWSHIALYVGADRVIHMLGTGITDEDILTFTRCDDIAILRHSDKNIIAPAVARAYEQLESGVEYDYDFNTDSSERFYCSEFVDYCFDYLDKEKIFSKMAQILPDDFLKYPAFDLVWYIEENYAKMLKRIAK